MKQILAIVAVFAATVLTGCAHPHEVRQDVRIKRNIPTPDGVGKQEVRIKTEVKSDKKIKFGSFTLWNPDHHDLLENSYDLKKPKEVPDKRYEQTGWHGLPDIYYNRSSYRSEYKKVNPLTRQPLTDTVDTFNETYNQTWRPHYGWGWGYWTGINLPEAEIAPPAPPAPRRHTHTQPYRPPRSSCGHSHLNGRACVVSPPGAVTDYPYAK